MEMLIKVAWGLLALIHTPPAAVLFAPTALRRLYGVDPGGDIGVLLTHRGALFFALVALCIHALLAPPTRRGASLAVAISVVGYLVVYARSGFPPGALRTIALVDAAALGPLAIVLATAWRDQAA